MNEKSSCVFLCHYRSDRRIRPEPFNEKVSSRTLRIVSGRGTACPLPPETESLAIGLVPLEGTVGRVDCPTEIPARIRFRAGPQIRPVRPGHTGRKHSQLVHHFR